MGWIAESICPLPPLRVHVVLGISPPGAGIGVLAVARQASPQLTGFAEPFQVIKPGCLALLPLLGLEPGGRSIVQPRSLVFSSSQTC